MQCNLTKFSTLTVNIIIDVNYLVYEIFTNYCTFLCKKCDIGYYYVYKSSNEIDDYWLVFLVSVSLSCKILNAYQK